MDLSFVMAFSMGDKNLGVFFFGPFAHVHSVWGLHSMPFENEAELSRTFTLNLRMDFSNITKDCSCVLYLNGSRLGGALACAIFAVVEAFCTVIPATTYLTRATKGIAIRAAS